MNVCFDTFGCRLNRAEALEMEAAYRANGWSVTSEHSEADLIVVRACSVTARAQRECEQHIGHLRRKYPMAKLRIVGCTDTKVPILPRVYTPDLQQTAVATEVPTRTARAYLKVQDGCNSECTFCIVPHYRGKAVSVPLEAVLNKARAFIAAGYRELVVTGCNLSQYADSGNGICDLLIRLAELDSGVRIRIGSIEPVAAIADIADIIAAHENIARFLHVSVQSASDPVLSAMKRPYRIRDVKSMLDRVRRQLPMIGLGCDLIAGFPGESDLDFCHTKAFLREYPFSNAHVFPYSERPGTIAATMPRQVDRKLRSERAHELVGLASEKRRSFARRFIGKEVDVVIENAEKLTGWTGEYLWCESSVDAKGKARRRDLVRFKVTDVDGSHLVGSVC